MQHLLRNFDRSILTVFRGLTTPHRGQLEADPGVLILGYPGDPLVDNPLGPQRPDWARDGSYMVFRKLEQDVKGWNTFVAKSAKYWQEFTPVPDEVQPPFKDDDEKANFVGAALVGRWKSVCYSTSFHSRCCDHRLTFERRAPQFNWRISEMTRLSPPRITPIISIIPCPALFSLQIDTALSTPILAKLRQEILTRI